ncbi:hypothetical protein [Mycobacteroides salmoniphilum]|uniref:hypothetical protein n=1 Tax=Mycobacteroides salmoniphilum TaxID=404941 RepID=UPI001F441A32|nr:hypothetical protein [Mycobacteroides salmoniphilum]
MADDASLAQARVLLASLYEHINEVSQSMAKTEEWMRLPTRHPVALRRRQQRVHELRKDLYEAHHLVTGLHRRFPATRDTVWPTTSLNERS